MTPAVIFDFDGVIVDSEYELACAVIDALAARGADVGLEEFAHLFGSTELDGEWELLLRHHLGDGLTLEELDAELWSGPMRTRLDSLPLMPGVAELLESLREARWPVGLATGTGRARLDASLERLGLTGAFDAIVTRPEVLRGKPNPDIYLEASARLAVPPQDCVAIEDSLPGAQAAAAAGMAVVLCPSRATARCAFPEGLFRVGCLDQLELAGLARASGRAGGAIGEAGVG